MERGHDESACGKQREVEPGGPGLPSRDTAPAAEPQRKQSFWSDKPKPFLEHLEELRRALLWSLAAVAAGMAASFWLAPRIFEALRAPLSAAIPNPEQFLRSIEITGGFSILMKIAAWSGLILSSPFILFFAARFILPGLTERERKAVLAGIALASSLFLLGVTLCYFIVLPLTLRMMLQIHEWLSIKAEWTINSYVDFSMRLLLAFGLAFELPVVVLALGCAGVISSGMLRAKRPHAIVVILIIAAFLTPPDIFSQLAMGIPMILLYEVCIWMITIFEQRSG